MQQPIAQPEQQPAVLRPLIIIRHQPVPNAPFTATFHHPHRGVQYEAGFANAYGLAGESLGSY